VNATGIAEYPMPLKGTDVAPDRRWTPLFWSLTEAEGEARQFAEIPES
jgi:hypothetical protein